MFCEFTLWSSQKFFSSEKNQSMFYWWKCLSSLKSFTTRSFLLLLMACDKKITLFHIKLEISNGFIHSLLNKKLRHSHVLGYRFGWLVGMVVNQGLDLLNKFRSTFLIRTIRVRLLRYRTFVITIRLIQLFSNPLLCIQTDS